ncbi:hypothetical protein MAR621_03000 [Maribacter dokdonensis]|nr:hypothetical protein [Maribacter dokdonensis]CAG2532806.1 hypothetical protein MAR621_03000 [Maribacter dokdonensis]
MKDVLVWNQGGVKSAIFSKHILAIEGSSQNEKVCYIRVDYNDEPVTA